jgi:hypothetical protein
VIPSSCAISGYFAISRRQLRRALVGAHLRSSNGQRTIECQRWSFWRIKISFTIGLALIVFLPFGPELRVGKFNPGVDFANGNGKSFNRVEGAALICAVYQWDLIVCEKLLNVPRRVFMQGPRGKFE